MYGVRPRACPAGRVEAAEQIRDAPAPRNDRARCELGKRLQHEAALVQPGMRDRKPGLVDHEVAVEEQVEVDRPRPPSFLVVANTAEAPLDVTARSRVVAGRTAADCARLAAALLEQPPPR